MKHTPKSETVKPSRFRNLEQLATRLGVDRRTVARILALPDAPQQTPDGWDEGEVLFFALDSAPCDSMLALVDDRFRALKLEEMRLKNSLRTIELAQARGEGPVPFRNEMLATARAAWGKELAKPTAAKKSR